MDDVTINCVLGIESVSNLDSSTLLSSDTLLNNFLYNAGFMFTDILDMVYYDTTNSDPYWYYIFFRVGDFMVRFVYRDTSLI
jgi:hypothetical protein